MEDKIELERAEGTAANSADDKLSVLRELRAEVQDIQSLLTNVRDGRAILGVYAPYIATNKREIATLFRRIAKGMPDEAVLPSDSIGHLSNLWQQLLCTSIIAEPERRLEPE